MGIEPPPAIAESSEQKAPDSDVEASGEERDSKKAPKGTTSLDVEIFGSVYHVRGKQNPEYLLELAEVVDGKMREISHHVGVVDSGKIAILAALNLADELLQCNDQQEGERVEMMEKVEELTGVLNEALNDRTV
ncbi:MAG: cell division protein ZapA [bacterium]|nr:cell division protein ZapA [bacterium]